MRFAWIKKKKKRNETQRDVIHIFQHLGACELEENIDLTCVTTRDKTRANRSCGYSTVV